MGWSFPPAALAILYPAFEKDRYCTPQRKAALAAQTGLTPKQVQKWFSNRRHPRHRTPAIRKTRSEAARHLSVSAKSMVGAIYSTASAATTTILSFSRASISSGLFAVRRALFPDTALAAAAAPAPDSITCRWAYCDNCRTWVEGLDAEQEAAADAAEFWTCAACLPLSEYEQMRLRNIASNSVCAPRRRLCSPPRPAAPHIQPLPPPESPIILSFRWHLRRPWRPRRGSARPELSALLPYS